MDQAAEAELDVPLGQLIQNVAGVRQRPGEPVQLRYHEGVAGPARGKGKPKTWTVAVGASEAVVDIDPVVADAECMQAITLRGEVLLLRRYACVSHQ